MKIADIEITHPKKVLFPEKNITKGDVARYYDKIAEYMLPYLHNRPLTLQRYPDGIGRQGFYQKHAQDYFPDFIERVTVKTREGTAEEIMVNNKKSLVYLANYGVIAFHIWLSTKERLDRPNKVIFDLDASGKEFGKLKQGARLLKALLQKQAINPNLMTTGKRGLHVYYEITPERPFEDVRGEARTRAQVLVDDNPGLFTLESRKNKRGDKIFIDILRNAFAQTGICPFSLRPNPSAGVATPLEWRELSRISGGDQFTYNTIFRRLAAKNR